MKHEHVFRFLTLNSNVIKHASFLRVDKNAQERELDKIEHMELCCNSQNLEAS